MSFQGSRKHVPQTVKALFALSLLVTGLVGVSIPVQTCDNPLMATGFQQKPTPLSYLHAMAAYADDTTDTPCNDSDGDGQCDVNPPPSE